MNGVAQTMASARANQTCAVIPSREDGEEPPIRMEAFPLMNVIKQLA